MFFLSAVKSIPLRFFESRDSLRKALVSRSTDACLDFFVIEPPKDDLYNRRPLSTVTQSVVSYTVE